MLYLVYGCLDTQCGSSSLWLILSPSWATVGYYCTRRLTHAQKSLLCLCATVLAPFGKFNHLESGKCQKGTNNASCWLCSHWRMLSQDGILTWTRSVFCFGNVQASTGYPALTAVMKIFFSFPGLLSFQCTCFFSVFFFRICPFFFFTHCLFSFVFFPLTNTPCFSVPLILRYLQWRHCLVNAEKAHEFYMALVQFQQLVPEGCAISFQNGRMQKPLGNSLCRTIWDLFCSCDKTLKMGENGLL